MIGRSIGGGHVPTTDTGRWRRTALPLAAMLVLAAVADAQRRALETVQAEMQKLPSIAGDRGA